jgi:hypothetical protein
MGIFLCFVSFSFMSEALVTLGHSARFAANVALVPVVKVVYNGLGFYLRGTKMKNGRAQLPIAPTMSPEYEVLSYV